MKRNYRAGQTVKVRVGGLAGLHNIVGNTERLIDCMVICATPTGCAYCVSALDYRFAAVIDADDIITKPEKIEPRNPSDTSVVFFGNGSFALPVLEHLVEEGYNICAVVTNPDSKQGRGRQSRPTLVAEYARSKKLNVLTPLSISDPKLIGEIKRLNPSVGVVVEYGILPKSVHRMPKHGTINLHSSLLPEYRGASTISSAIKDGKPYTGLTTFLLSDVVDGGDIINNIFIPIEGDDNSEDVLAKMRVHGPGMVSDAIQLLIQGKPLVPQATIGLFLSPTDYASKVFHDDLKIEWNMTAKQVCDFVRAYAPSPSAWTNMDTKEGEQFRCVKIHKASATNIPSGEKAGAWRVNQGRLLIAASDYLVSVEELQFPGKRRMSALDFCNGFRGCASGTCDHVGQ